MFFFVKNGFVKAHNWLFVEGRATTNQGSSAINLF